MLKYRRSTATQTCNSPMETVSVHIHFQLYMKGPSHNPAQRHARHTELAVVSSLLRDIRDNVMTDYGGVAGPEIYALRPEPWWFNSMHVHSRSSSLRDYQITTPWWIPVRAVPHLQRWTCGMPRRGGFTLGGREGIWHSARIFSFPPNWVTSCAALVLDIFNTKKGKKQRKRMVSMGLLVFPSYIFGLLSWS